MMASESKIPRVIFNTLAFLWAAFVATLLIVGLTGCQLTPQGQARVADLQQEKVELREDLEVAKELNAELRSRIEAGEEVDPEEFETLEGIVKRLFADLEAVERKITQVKSEDRGQQARSWMELIALLGVGGAGFLGSRVGPSRSAQELALLREKLRRLEAGLEGAQRGLDPPS